MRAIGYKKNGPIDVLDSLIEFEAPVPKLNKTDLLVRVHGISVNPIDIKVRKAFPAENGMKIIGYDAAGIVKEVGPSVKNFKVGDEVFYAGDITRAGTNCELHAVDERIVGKKPQSLSFQEAAGLPLTSITAWEMLFDSFRFKEGDGQGEAILIIGGAGGVGSILIQLAKKLTKLKVIATASRPQTIKWVEKMGADHVVNHQKPLANQMQQLNIKPRYVASLNGSEGNFQSIVDLIKPRGHIVLIDDIKTFDIRSVKQKSLSLSWEFMFARPMHQTDDMQKQSELLNRVSKLIDEGVLISTVTNNLGKLSVETLKEAHVQQESNRVIGKNVLEGF